MRANEVGPVVTNGGKAAIDLGRPYQVTALIKGTADLLFHRWNCEAVAEKAAASKGSKAKKTDDVDSYVYRNDDGMLCLPGEYLRQAIIAAAKFRQDPRSPRKSAKDLFKAGVVSLTELAPIGPKPVKDWDYLHKCRVTIQQSGITRSRPAMKAGWQAEIVIAVLLPEYIRPDDLQDTLTQAGKLIGVGDFRPTYGRFAVMSFDIGLQD